MYTVDSIIDRLGGQDAAAKLLGVGTEAVRKWRQSKSIPSRHWPAVITAAKVTLADLSGVPTEAPPIMPTPHEPPEGATAALVLADGTVFWGVGFGAHGPCKPGEVCFNTGMTGYQETLTDPSYAGQIICFTFPHIGNTGANPEDMEAPGIAARGLIVKEQITEPSNWRSLERLDSWLKARNVTGISGVDTRALTARIRDIGAPHGLVCYPAGGHFDIQAMIEAASEWPGLEGMDLAKTVTCGQSYQWNQTTWVLGRGYGKLENPRFHVVAVDYGAKRNILRSLATAGCQVTVVPATATAEEILSHHPDGIFLSNGPGDPAATGVYAVPAIQGVLAAGKPIFGICLGHQLLALALGARTYKLARGHRGANQPVKDLTTGKVEITSQNHGFSVDESTLPEGVIITHKSLFDGTNEGIAAPAQRAFSVQYHPEASPGPTDSSYLFRRFVAMMEG